MPSLAPGSSSLLSDVLLARMMVGGVDITLHPQEEEAGLVAIFQQFLMH